MNKLSIKARLIMGFGSIVLLFILFSTFVYKEMIDVDENLDLITADMIPITRTINDLRLSPQAAYFSTRSSRSAGSLPCVRT